MRASFRVIAWVYCLLAAFMLMPALGAGADQPPAAAAEKAQITILYDAFGKPSAMQKDWGFSALIEYGGKRILFDTGDNPDVLANNAKVAGADLSKLDFVVLSHRHGDHMGGMEYLLSVNPKVKIYAPKENFGVYGFSLPSSFYRKDPSLPAEQRYFDGAPPQVLKFGSAWPRANFELIDSGSVEIAPGVRLISLVSDKPTTLELRELSLVIETPDGIVLVVGCSHPGIDKVVDAAAAIDKHIHLVVGGFHMVAAKDPEIEKIVSGLYAVSRVDYVAPGHCTGEPTFAALRKIFGDHYVYAGLGTTLKLGAEPGPATPGSSNPGFSNPGSYLEMDQDELASYRALLAASDDTEEMELARAVR